MARADILVVGGTGLAGQAIVDAARSRGLRTVSLARGGDIAADVRDEQALLDAVEAAGADIIINAAAMVSLPQCERDPAGAYLVNARPAAILARTGRRLVQMSTDHFYSGDGRRLHAEDEPVRLLNEYARSKYAGETFALTAANALVVRTNFVGWPSASKTSFAEWAQTVIEDDQAATLFDDQFVSSLDVWSMADALLDLALKDTTGRINLAACEVYSKARFVQAFAAAQGRTLTRASLGSVGQGDTPRGDSLGLDVSRVQQVLQRSMPNLDKVVTALVTKLKERPVSNALEH